MKEKSTTKGVKGYCIERRIPVYQALRTMPPLSHWPLKPEPWRLEDSEVIAHIMNLVGEHYPDFADDWLIEAKRIMYNACHCDPKIIAFNPDTRLWKGADHE